MNDIRQTLETAFDDEPPLRLDLAAIKKAGRRRVAVRRSLTAAAVLATVTVVCVPAMLGSSGGGDVQVGAQPSGEVVTTVPSAREQPPVAGRTQQPPRPATAAHAAELTGLLTKSGVLPDVPGVGVPGNPGGAWEFAVSQGEYRAVTLLTGERAGQVVLSLSAQDFGCAGGNVPTTKCTLRWYEGVEVVVVDYWYGTTNALTVSAKAKDGTVFSATAVNSDDRGGSTGVEAPLSFQQLAKIATLPGVTF